MKYSDFEKYVSPRVANEWLNAANSNKRLAIQLYILFQRLSGQMYIVIGVLETVLRNTIDTTLSSMYGSNWIIDSISTNGFFSNQSAFNEIRTIIKTAIAHIHSKRMKYTHLNVLNNLEFGFWRYLFYKKNYIATGQCLMRIFTNKDVKTTDGNLVNQTFIYKELTKINQLRNRIAHYDISPIEALNMIIIHNELYIIERLLSWLGCSSPYKLNCVVNANKTINEIKKRSECMNLSVTFGH